jgi:Na+-transporting methylmalonyl-CoA/oxaloacetate decarboxylase gamma subunit
MNLSSINISFSNVFMGDFNAITFSLLGMGIVFAGLLTISLYIAGLPYVLNFIFKKPSKVGVAVKGDRKEIEKQESDIEVLIAIATAIHLEQNFAEDNQKITWADNHHEQDSGWQQTGLAARLAQRQNMSLRR